MKKLNFVNKIVLMFLGIVFFSCEKETVEAKIDANQEVFFEVNYINFAWGKQEGGFMIDKTGAVKKITALKHLAEEHKGYVTEAQMKEKLLFATEKKKEIAANELLKFTDLIPAIKSDNFSKRTNVGADMGAYTYYAYVYNANEKVYKAIKLAEFGDWTTENLDTNAKKITVWLKELQVEAFK